jgi:hypothetical protein
MAERLQAAMVASDAPYARAVFSPTSVLLLFYHQ